MSRRPISATPPWIDRVAVEQIPEAGLHREIVADQAVCAALRQLGGLREVLEARASFELHHARRGGVHVVGRAQARVGQTCVVTLEPMESLIDEALDVLFVPEDDVAALTKAQEDAADADADMPDPPEAIVNGTIDLGKLASDALFLGIDPYPRKPDAVFEAPAAAEDPESHPFAALKALKSESDKGD